MFFRTGLEFEEAVLGRKSSGFIPPEIYKRHFPDFGGDASKMILKAQKDGFTCPNTRLGKSLYRHTVKSLGRVGVTSDGLMFLPSDLFMDVYHSSDAMFYIPSLYPKNVTLDLFKIDNQDLDVLEGFWADSFQGSKYSDWDLQNDLFFFKEGFRAYQRECNESGVPLDRNLDYRRFCEKPRPRNHLLLTPRDVKSYGRRRAFSKLIAGYFRTIVDEKTALVGH